MSSQSGGSPRSAHSVTGRQRQVLDLIAEGLTGMAETAKAAGTYRSSRPCHPSTIVRWCLEGVRLGNLGTFLAPHSIG